MEGKVRILLVDDDDEFALLLEKKIRHDERFEYMGHAPDKETGVELARSLLPDVVIMDLALSGTGASAGRRTGANGSAVYEGVEAAKEIRTTTSAKVVFLSATDEPETMKTASKRAFASGYVCKSQHQNITDAIYHLANESTPHKEFIKELVLSDLTVSERAVLDEYLRERKLGSAGGISDAYGSSRKTKLNQRGRIVSKLNLKNADELFNVFNYW